METTSNNGIFTVNETGEFSFDYLFDGGWFQGELAVYNLEGMEQYTPGSAEYIQEAARRALSNSNDGYVVMKDRTEGAKYSADLHWEGNYNQGEYLGVKTFSMKPGAKFAFILTQQTSIQELADSPERYNQPNKLPIFSIPEANPDSSGEDAPQQFAALDAYGTFGFEGTRVDRQSDKDYNEVVFQVIGATAEAPYYGEVRNPGKNFRMSEIGEEIRKESKQNFFDDGYLIVSESGEIEVDFLLDGGWYKGEVGIFSLAGMNQYDSGSLAFIKEAAQRAISNSTDGYVLFEDVKEGARFDRDFAWEKNFNSGEYQGKKTFQLTAGGKYGLIMLPHGTLAEAASNPSLNAAQGKRAFFSMRAANQDNAIQAIEYEVGSKDRSVIGFEDVNVAFGSDRDYNDVVLSIEGASMYAPGPEEKDPNFEINLAPIAEDDFDTTFKDTEITISQASLLSNDYDLDGDSITVQSIDTTGTKGIVSQINGEFTYNPNGQFDGLSAGETATDSFTYTVTDGNGNIDTATVNVTIKGFDSDGNENNVGTLDSVHLLPPLYAKQDVRDHYLVLSTNEETPFQVTIQNADGANGIAGGINEVVTISKDSPLVLDLSSPPFANGNGLASLGVIDSSQVGQVDTVEGLILTGDQAFYANVRHQTANQGLSLSSKGQLALGTEFRSGHLVTNTNQSFRKSHFISVMASEDNTTVSFQDLPAGVEFINGYPGQVILDKYESFVIGVNIEDNVDIDLANSLQGSLITSDKPIAVNTGSWLGGTVGNARDIGVDQIVPTDLIGSKYILVKGEATSNANLLERAIVIATQDNTEVYLRGEYNTPFATLSAGETLILDGNEYQNSDALLIETNKAAYVYQMTSANNNTAPGLNLVLPVAENSGNQEILIPSIDLLGPGKLNIVARNTATINVNGSAISGGVAVEGDPEFVVYQINNLSGDVTVTSDESVIVTSTTGGGNIGSASFWSGLPTTLAFDDLVNTNNDTPITIDVLGNDLTGSGFKPIGLPQGPSNGNAIINEDNTITYTPDADFSGTDVFVYRGINESGKTDTAVVQVSVNQNQLSGTVNNDILTGSSIADRIVGLSGQDTITTGSGYDVIVFNAPGDGVDTITDFEVGFDRIDLVAILGAQDPFANAQVNFIQNGNDAIMQYNNSDLAVFQNSEANLLNDSGNFVF